MHALLVRDIRNTHQNLLKHGCCFCEITCEALLPNMLMLSVRRNVTGTPFSGVWSENGTTPKLRPALFIHLQQKSLCMALTDLNQSQHLCFHNL